MTNAEVRFIKSLRPRKPEGSLGRTAQDVHLDSHTAPELWPDPVMNWPSDKSLCPRKPEGSLGRTAQDVHLDSHTAVLNYERPSTSMPFIYYRGCYCQPVRPAETHTTSPWRCDCKNHLRFSLVTKLFSDWQRELLQLSTESQQLDRNENPTLTSKELSGWNFFFFFFFGVYM